MGYPAIPHRQAAKNRVILMRLHNWKQKVILLEERLAALEEPSSVKNMIP